MAGDHPNRGPYLFAVNVGFLVSAFVAAALRCIVRVVMVRNFGLDDWLMMFATCTFVSYIAFSITGVHYGTGQHHSDLSYENVTIAMRNWWCCYLFYSMTMISCKISIGWFLLRITAKKIHVWIIYIAMALSVVTGLVFFFVSFFQCHPISKFWDRRMEGKCINIYIIIALGDLYSAFSIISDFTFAILPGFIIWHLKMNMRTKVTLIPLMAMGCVASAAVVARIPALRSFANPDFLWATTDVAIWSTVEQGLAITAGSLAALRPLLRLIYHKAGFITGAQSRGPSRQPPGESGLMSPRGTHARVASKKTEEGLSLSNLSKSTPSKNLSVEGSWARKEKSEIDGLDRPLSPLGKGNILVTHEWECRSERKASGPSNESEEALNRDRISNEALDEEQNSWDRKGTPSFLVV